MSAFPKIKLTYFNAGGRAEATRLALFIGNVPFEDVRLSFEEFGASKSTYPYKQLPVLEVDGEILAQSEGIVRYAGKLSNLYPVNDPLAGLKIDDILGGMYELQDKMSPSFVENDPEKKKALREELANTVIPRYLKLIEARVEALKQYAVFQTSDVFVHEIVIFVFLRWLGMGVVDHIPTTVADSFTKLKAIEAKVGAHPKVKEWYANPRNASTKLKLTYFDGPGRAEPIRLAFHIGNVEFEDERIQHADLEALKPSLPYGQVPVLHVNGEIHAQSLEILRYAGLKSGLYPATDFVQGLRIDEVFGVADDMYTSLSPTYRMEPEAQLAARKVLVEEKFPVLLGGLDKRIANWGGPYAVGSKLTVADLTIYGMILTVQSGRVNGIPTTLVDAYPNIMRVHKLVLEHPKVKEWNEKH